MRAKFLAAVVLALLCGMIQAQEKDCSIVASMARMARAKSIGVLLKREPKANDNYDLRAVFAARKFELEPNNKEAAASLFTVIPRNDNEQNIWMNMPSSQCDEEPVSDMISLGKLADRFARDLARAAILNPNKMQDYVSYSGVAAGNPHSDYAVQMEKVCRLRHSDFARAVDQLGAGSRESDYLWTPGTVWFREHILNPQTCHALVFPEAD